MRCFLTSQIHCAIQTTSIKKQLYFTQQQIRTTQHRNHVMFSSLSTPKTVQKKLIIRHSRISIVATFLTRGRAHTRSHTHTHTHTRSHTHSLHPVKRICQWIYTSVHYTYRAAPREFSRGTSCPTTAVTTSPREQHRESAGQQEQPDSD